MDIILAGLATADLETTINELSMTTVTIGSIALILLVVAAMVFNKMKAKINNRAKKPIFISIVTVITVVTLVISGGTVYLNTVSYAGGPVHWHADYEIWACGNELDLRNPRGFLSNKIGTATLHEHNDRRVHLEGVPIAPEDASLGKFMRVVGGQVSNDTLVVPLSEDKYFMNEQKDQDGDGNGAPVPEQVEPFIRDDKEGKIAEFISGQKCGDKVSEVQVFAYKIDEKAKTYKQTKLSVPEDYVISGKGQVPPGDCIIMEFGPARARTDKLCRQFGIRDIDQCDKFGVTGESRKICEYREVR